MVVLKCIVTNHIFYVWTTCCIIPIDSCIEYYIGTAAYNKRRVLDHSQPTHFYTRIEVLLHDRVIALGYLDYSL